MKLLIFLTYVVQSSITVDFRGPKSTAVSKKTAVVLTFFGILSEAQNTGSVVKIKNLNEPIQISIFVSIHL